MDNSVESTRDFECNLDYNLDCDRNLETARDTYLDRPDRSEKSFYNFY